MSSYTFNETANSTSHRQTGPINVGIEGLDGDRMLGTREAAIITSLPIQVIADRCRDGTIRAFRTGHGARARWRIRLSDLYKAFPGLQDVLEPKPDTRVSEYEIGTGEYELGGDGLKPAE